MNIESPAGVEILHVAIGLHDDLLKNHLFQGDFILLLTFQR